MSACREPRAAQTAAAKVEAMILVRLYIYMCCHVQYTTSQQSYIRSTRQSIVDSMLEKSVCLTATVRRGGVVGAGSGEGREAEAAGFTLGRTEE